MAKSSLRSHAPLALPLFLALAACNCDPPGTQATSGDLVAEQTSLVFGEICAGGGATQIFTLQNIGNGDLTVALSVSGADARFFTVEPTALLLASGGGSAEFTVTYSPGPDELDKHHFAQIDVGSDATSGNASAAITVDGETSAQPPKPILSLTCGDGVPTCREAPAGMACCTPIEQLDGRNSLGTLNFGDTPRGSTAILPIKVTNLGCGELTLSAVTLVATGSGMGYCAAESATVSTATPVSIPGGTDPLNRASTDVELRFAPTELCTYTGRVTFETNDPDIITGTNTEGYAQANILGSGTEARVTVDRECLFFGDIDIGTPVPLTVHVSNVGTQAIQVSELRIRGGNPDFSIGPVTKTAPDCGAAPETIEAPFELAATNALQCGADEVDVTITYLPTNPAGQDEDDLELVYAGGVAVVCLRGGSQPAIVVTPDGINDQIEFRSSSQINGCGRSTGIPSCGDADCTNNCVNEMDCACVDGRDCADSLERYACLGGFCTPEPACVETCTSGDKVYEVCNAGRAQLEIASPDGVLLTGASGGAVPVHSDPDRLGQPMFELRNDNCSGTTLQPGECCDGTVHFSDASNGGVKTAELHIFSNDPSYPREAGSPGGGGYIVAVMAVTDVDFPPVPTFMARPESNPAAEDCSFCRAGEWIILDASGTTDDSGPVQDFRWELRSISGASSIQPGMIDPANPDALCGGANGGDCVEFIGSPVGKVIRFWPDIASNYTFRLFVTDGICNPPHASDASSGVSISN